MAPDHNGEWLARAPRGLDLTPLISRHRIPTSPDDPVWGSAATALAHAYGGQAQAAHALLGWLASAPLPWIGFPGPDCVAVTLLEWLGPAALATVLRGEPDERLWLAAGRALATGKRALAVPPELLELAGRLHGLVQAHAPDHAVTLERRLRPETSASRLSRPIEELGRPHSNAMALAIDRSQEDGPAYLCDGKEVVEVSRQGRRVLAQWDGFMAELAVDGRRVLLADLGGGQVVTVDRASGAVTVLAAGEPSPSCPSLLSLGTGAYPDGRASWLALRDRTVLVRMETGPGSVRTVAEIDAFGVPLCHPATDYFALVSRERYTAEPGDLRRFARLVMLDLAGQLRPMAMLSPATEVEDVLLEFGPDAIYWTTQGELWTCTHQLTAPRRLARLPGRPQALAVSRPGAVVLVRGDDDVLVLCVARDGTIDQLAAFADGSEAPHSMVCSASFATLASNAQLLRLPIAKAAG